MKNVKFARLAGMGMLAIGATVVQASFVEVASASAPADQQVVRIRDFDLNKSEDVARLYKRLRNAATTACDAEAITGTLLLSRNQLKCIDEAVGAAVARVHNERLTAYYQQKTQATKSAERPGSAGKESMPGVTHSDRD